MHFPYLMRLLVACALLALAAHARGDFIPFKYNWVSLSSVVARQAPEPAIFGLLALGGGISLCRRRNRAR